MRLTLNTCALLGVGIVLRAAASSTAMAQGWLDPDARYYLSASEWQMRMTMMRVALVVLASGLGFALGWVMSPQAASVRRSLLLLIALAAGAVVMFDHGTLGWSAATSLAVIGFCVGLGYWLGKSLRKLAEVPTTFGSAQWADAEHMEEKGLFQRDGIILGSVRNGDEEKIISYKGDRHLLTSAPTRSGKGASQIVTNLLTYEGSVLVIDPKGENALITAKARQEMGHEVRLIDPWNVAASKLCMEPARFNPLDWIDLTDPDATENAMLQADALVQKTTKTDAFWLEESKAVLQGLILLVAFDAEYEGRRDLGTVRDLLLLTGKKQQELFTYMAQSPHALIASTGARCLQKEEKLMASVMASAQAETHMLDSQRLRESLSASDVAFDDLKTKPLSIYLILPADRLETFSRFLRLLVQQAITVNARNIDVKPEKPVLFLLDEMPSLGRLTMVEQAYGLMAGFGIQLWGITQDLCQLRRVYGEDYESFIANSGAVSYFGSPDKTSAEYFSSLCGVTTVWNLSSAVASAVGSSSGGSGGSSTSSTTHTDNRAATQRKLAYPDELMRLPDDQQILLIENTNPILAKKVRWYNDPELKHKGFNTYQA